MQILPFGKAARLFAVTETGGIMTLSPEVKKEIKIMTFGCAVCAVLVFAGFCIFDAFSLPLLFGSAVGYLLAVGNFYFMSVGVTAALNTGEEIAAKRKLRISYTLRTVGILAVLVCSILLNQSCGMINWIPVAAGVFYVRIVILARGVLNYFKLKNAPPAPADDAADGGNEKSPSTVIEEEEEEEDGFEKFVGHFAKGPIPGKTEDKENKK